MGLGLHGGGVGTVKFLHRAGANITVTDLRPRRVLAPSLAILSRYKKIRYVLGRHRRQDILEADFIVKNPGVRPDSFYLRLASKNKIPVTSDLGIFFNYSPATIIGVTGTRGKSTTAFLIWKFLKTKFSRVYLGGNIRKSVLEFLPDLRPGDMVILELSSFQLADLAREKKSPSLAVFTSLYRDHLNWHKSMSDYVKAKAVIFKFQKPSDYLFANPADKAVRQLIKSAPSRKILPRLSLPLKKIVKQNLGQHYEPAVALAAAIAKHFNVSISSVEKILQNFRGLAERQQKIATVRGVTFIDDTTATSPDAALAALKRFRALAGKKKLILIGGGQDKNLDFRKFSAAIKRKTDLIIFLPGTATRIIRKKLLASRFPASQIREAKSMAHAVRLAYEFARRGDIVLLSPGAASFGLFLNEFDRGKQFIKAVKNLRSNV